jgi:hypothetical protein
MIHRASGHRGRKEQSGRRICQARSGRSDNVSADPGILGRKATEADCLQLKAKDDSGDKKLRNQTVIVMQTIQDGNGHQLPPGRQRSSELRIRIWNSVNALVHSALVVPEDKFSQDSTRMALIPDQQVIKTFPALCFRGIDGRPTLPSDFRPQYSRNFLLLHRITVSGLTINSSLRQCFQILVI